MRSAFRASLRYYARHPWQFILAIFGIALGVTMAVAIELATGGAQRAFDRSLQTLTGTATHRIVAQGGALTDATYTHLRLAGFRNIAPLVEIHGRAQGETVRLLGVDPFAEGGFRDHLRGGEDADITALIVRPATVFASAATAARLGTAVGDALAFSGLFLLVLGVALLTPFAVTILSRWGMVLLRRSGSASLRLALGGIPSSLSRTGVALAALSIAVATTIGVGLMISSFRTAVDDWLQATLQADIYVSAPSSGSRSSPGELDATLQRRILELPGVAAASRGRLINLETAEGITELFVLDLPPTVRPWHRLRDAVPEVWTRFRAGDGVLVSEPYAWHHAVGPGDRLTLPTRSGERSFPILGVYQDYRGGGDQVLVPRRLHLAIQDDTAIGSLGLYLAAGADANTALRDVRQAVADSGTLARVQSAAELRTLSLTVFDRTFTVTGVLRLLALLVAVAGVLGALLALQFERRAALATLRMLGFTPGGIFSLVTVQSGIMGVLAGLIAVPTGALLAIVLVRVINVRSFGWTMDMRIDSAVLVEGFAAAVIAALVAGLYPAWRAARATPAGALRNE